MARLRRSSALLLTTLGVTGALRALAIALVSAFAIAIPTRLVPNSFFRRMTPVRPQDYVFLVVASLMIGVVFALRDRARREARAMTAGIGTVLAVGCPVCNKLVVILLGTAGATSVFAPLQPVIGTASVMILAFAIRAQLLGAAGECTIPVNAGTRHSRRPC